MRDTADKVFFGFHTRWEYTKKQTHPWMTSPHIWQILDSGMLVSITARAMGVDDEAAINVKLLELNMNRPPIH